eukprot:855636-Prorocentrum_minimum.AAC.1
MAERRADGRKRAISLRLLKVCTAKMHLHHASFLSSLNTERIKLRFLNLVDRPPPPRPHLLLFPNPYTLGPIDE